MKKVFLNCTNHNLTERQKEVAKNEYDINQFVELKDVAPALFKELSNVIVNENNYHEKTNELVNKFIDFLNDYVVDKFFIYVHLPIGSPYFQFLFGRYSYRLNFNVKLVFSYSERKVINEKDDNGNVIKKSVFEFKFFQILNDYNDNFNCMKNLYVPQWYDKEDLSYILDKELSDKEFEKIKKYLEDNYEMVISDISDNIRTAIEYAIKDGYI